MSYQQFIDVKIVQPVDANGRPTLVSNLCLTMRSVVHMNLILAELLLDMWLDCVF
jgi:hypothetical protein